MVVLKSVNLERYKSSSGYGYLIEKVNVGMSKYSSKNIEVPSSSENNSISSYYSVSSGEGYIKFRRNSYNSLVNITTLRFEKTSYGHSLISSITLKYIEKGVTRWRTFKYTKVDNPFINFASITFEDGEIRKIFDISSDVSEVEINVRLTTSANDSHMIENDSSYLLKDGGMYKYVEVQKPSIIFGSYPNVNVSDINMRLEEDEDIFTFLLVGTKEASINLNINDFKSYFKGMKYYYKDTRYYQDIASVSVGDFNEIIYLYVSLMNTNNRTEINLISVDGKGKVVNTFKSTLSKMKNIKGLTISEIANISELTILDRELTEYDVVRYFNRDLTQEDLEPLYSIKFEEDKVVLGKKEEVERKNQVRYTQNFEIKELGERFPTAEDFKKYGFPLSLLKTFSTVGEVSKENIAYKNKNDDLYVKKYEIPYRYNRNVKILNSENNLERKDLEWQQLV